MRKQSIQEVIYLLTLANQLVYPVAIFPPSVNLVLLQDVKEDEIKEWRGRTKAFFHRDRNFVGDVHHIDKLKIGDDVFELYSRKRGRVSPIALKYMSDKILSYSSREFPTLKLSDIMESESEVESVYKLKRDKKVETNAIFKSSILTEIAKVSWKKELKYETLLIHSTPLFDNSVEIKIDENEKKVVRDSFLANSSFGLIESFNKDFRNFGLVDITTVYKNGKEVVTEKLVEEYLLPPLEQRKIEVKDMIRYQKGIFPPSPVVVLFDAITVFKTFYCRNKKLIDEVEDIEKVILSLYPALRARSFDPSSVPPPEYFS